VKAYGVSTCTECRMRTLKEGCVVCSGACTCTYHNTLIISAGFVKFLLGGRDAKGVEGFRGYRLRGLGERRKLPQWGPGQSPGRKRIWWTLELPESHWWQSFL